MYSEASEVDFFTSYDWVEDIEAAVAEITKWVEAGGVEAVGPAENVSGNTYLFHSDWGDSTKSTALKLEVAALTGLNPKDIRPVVRDLEGNEDMQSIPAR